MDMIKMKRLGNTKNYYIQVDNYHFNVFRHVSYNDALCLTIDKLNHKSWNRLQLTEYNNITINPGDNYTAKFLNNYLYDVSSPRLQLISFVRDNFNIELDFPLD